jgi:hypothetical protein
MLVQMFAALSEKDRIPLLVVAGLCGIAGAYCLLSALLPTRLLIALRMNRIFSSRQLPSGQMTRYGHTDAGDLAGRVYNLMMAGIMAAFVWGLLSLALG